MIIPPPHHVHISVNQEILEGDLTIPEKARAIVLFVHGSGSSRLSPRNQHVAQTLNQAGFATLLFDLLTNKEENIDNLTAEYRFDIDLLTNRLIKTTKWVVENPATKNMSIGYFGASTGAAAALLAAAKLPETVKAIVSRGGRPDLAERSLKNVQTPTLLMIGGNDEPVILMNNFAFEKLQCEKKIVIIPGATHLFEEAGKLEDVAELAHNWFKEHLVSQD
jgi:putative phosphoribosyl transferase